MIVGGFALWPMTCLATMSEFMIMIFDFHDTTNIYFLATSLDLRKSVCKVSFPTGSPTNYYRVIFEWQRSSLFFDMTF